MVPWGNGQNIVSALGECYRQTTDNIAKTPGFGPRTDFSGNEDDTQWVCSFVCFTCEGRFFTPGHCLLPREALALSKCRRATPEHFWPRRKRPGASAKPADLRMWCGKASNGQHSLAKGQRRDMHDADVMRCCTQKTDAVVDRCVGALEASQGSR